MMAFVGDIRSSLAPADGRQWVGSPCRLASNRNHTRRSAWSIQFSSRLALATSPCVSHLGASRACARQLQVVAQLGQHVQRRHVVRVVVEHALQASDLADRAERRAADLAHALGDIVGRGKYLLGLLVQQQVVVTEMRARHMPMKILRLEIQREDVREQKIERG